MAKKDGPYDAVAIKDLNEDQVAVTMRNASGHEVIYHIYKKPFFERLEQSQKKDQTLQRLLVINRRKNAA